MAPAGSSKTQLQHSMTKAKEFYGKFVSASMSHRAKWITITMVIKPALLYPFVNILFNGKAIKAIDSITSRMKCLALGLNRNFPRAILHGPTLLGGIETPSASQKNTKDRINYFLYNIQCHPSLSEKFEIAIVYMQMEVGTFQQFFSLPYLQYGHLATISFCVQLWQELEPQGLILQPVNDIMWQPIPFSPQDISIMELAISKYDAAHSNIINRCRIYLQIIFIYDLLLYGTSQIHPSYIEGTIPISRISLITWPSLPKPPPCYWKIWKNFLMRHITPIIQSHTITWNSMHTNRYNPVFYKHRQSLHLYKYSEGELAETKPKLVFQPFTRMYPFDRCDV
jgi:hypothetical protein